MRHFLLTILSCLLVASMLTTAAPLVNRSTVAASSVLPDKKEKQIKVKKGPEVAARVRELRTYNPAVRAALKRFEDKKRAPKIDESFTFTSAPDTAVPLTAGDFKSDVAFRKVAFQDYTSSYDNFTTEMTFIPALSVEREWQGTVIQTIWTSDASGSFWGQYIADVAMYESDPNTYTWDVVYEESSGMTELR
jgi:hypothetical protein